MTSPPSLAGPSAKRPRLDLEERRDRSSQEPISTIAERTFTSEVPMPRPIEDGRVVAVSADAVNKALKRLNKWLIEETALPLSQEEMGLVRAPLLQVINLSYCLPPLDGKLCSLLQKTTENFIWNYSHNDSSLGIWLQEVIYFIRELLNANPVKVVLKSKDDFFEEMLSSSRIEKGEWLYNTALALLKASPATFVHNIIPELKMLNMEEREEVCSFALELMKLAPHTCADSLVRILRQIGSEKRKEIQPIALETLKLSRDSDPGYFIRILGEISAHEQMTIVPFVFKLLKAAPHSDVGRLIDGFKRMGAKKTEEREAVFSFVEELLRVAPYTEAGHLIHTICSLHPARREEICHVALKLLKAAPHSNAGDLIHELGELYSRLDTDTGSEREEIEEICSMALEQLKIAFNTKADRLINKLRDTFPDERKRIRSVILKMLKAAPNADASYVVDKTKLSDEDSLQKNSFIVLECLHLIPEVDPSVLMNQYIKTLPEGERVPVETLIAKLSNDHPNVTMASIITTLYKTPKEGWEEICPLVLRLMEVSPSSNVGYLATMLTKAFPANKELKEEWEKRYSIALQLLKTSPSSNAGYLISLLSDISANEEGRFFSLFNYLREIFPSSHIEDLVYAVHTLTHEERRGLNTLLCQELPQYPEPSLTFLKQDVSDLIALFKKTSKRTRTAVFTFILQALKNQPNLAFEAVTKWIRTLSEKEQVTVCSFLTSHLYRNPETDVFVAIDTYKQLHNPDVHLDLSIKKEFLPFLAPEHIRELVQAATEEEVKKAFAKSIHLEVLKDDAPVIEALQLGIDHGVEAIEKGFQEGIYTESNKGSFEEAFRLITHFLDELEPFTLSLAAANEKLQHLVLRYLPFMQERHLAVVLPHISPEKLYEELSALKKGGWPEGLLINQVYGGRANQPL